MNVQLVFSERRGTGNDDEVKIRFAGSPTLLGEIFNTGHHINTGDNHGNYGNHEPSNLHPEWDHEDRGPPLPGEDVFGDPDQHDGDWPSEEPPYQNQPPRSPGYRGNSPPSYHGNPQSNHGYHQDWRRDYPYFHRPPLGYRRGYRGRPRSVVHITGYHHGPHSYHGYHHGLPGYHGYHKGPPGHHHLHRTVNTRHFGYNSRYPPNHHNRGYHYPAPGYHGYLGTPWSRDGSHSRTPLSERRDTVIKVTQDHEIHVGAGRYDYTVEKDYQYPSDPPSQRKQGVYKESQRRPPVYGADTSMVYEGVRVVDVTDMGEFQPRVQRVHGFTRDRVVKDVRTSVHHPWEEWGRGGYPPPTVQFTYTTLQETRAPFLVTKASADPHYPYYTTSVHPFYVKWLTGFSLSQHGVHWTRTHLTAVESPVQLSPTTPMVEMNQHVITLLVVMATSSKHNRLQHLSSRDKRPIRDLSATVMIFKEPPPPLPNMVSLAKGRWEVGTSSGTLIYQVHSTLSSLQITSPYSRGLRGERCGEVTGSGESPTSPWSSKPLSDHTNNNQVVRQQPCQICRNCLRGNVNTPTYFCPGEDQGSNNERLRKRDTTSSYRRLCIHGFSGPYFWSLQPFNYFVIWNFNSFSTMNLFSFYNFYNRFIYRHTQLSSEFSYPERMDPAYRLLRAGSPVQFCICSPYSNVRAQFSPGHAITRTFSVTSSHSIILWGGVGSRRTVRQGYVTLLQSIIKWGPRGVLKPRTQYDISEVLLMETHSFSVFTRSNSAIIVIGVFRWGAVLSHKKQLGSMKSTTHIPTILRLSTSTIPAHRIIRTLGGSGRDVRVVGMGRIYREHAHLKMEIRTVRKQWVLDPHGSVSGAMVTMATTPTVQDGFQGGLKIILLRPGTVGRRGVVEVSQLSNVLLGSKIDVVRGHVFSYYTTTHTYKAVYKESGRGIKTTKTLQNTLSTSRYRRSMLVIQTTPASSSALFLISLYMDGFLMRAYGLTFGFELRNYFQVTSYELIESFSIKLQTRSRMVGRHVLSYTGSRRGIMIVDHTSAEDMYLDRVVMGTVNAHRETQLRVLRVVILRIHAIPYTSDTAGIQHRLMVSEQVRRRVQSNSWRVTELSVSLLKTKHETEREHLITFAVIRSILSLQNTVQRTGIVSATRTVSSGVIAKSLFSISGLKSGYTGRLKVVKHQISELYVVRHKTGHACLLNSFQDSNSELGEGTLGHVTTGDMIEKKHVLRVVLALHSNVWWGNTRKRVTYLALHKTGRLTVQIHHQISVMKRYRTAAFYLAFNAFEHHGNQLRFQTSTAKVGDVAKSGMVSKVLTKRVDSSHEIEIHHMVTLDHTREMTLSSHSDSVTRTTDSRILATTSKHHGKATPVWLEVVSKVGVSTTLFSSNLYRRYKSFVFTVARQRGEVQGVGERTLMVWDQVKLTRVDTEHKHTVKQSVLVTGQPAVLAHRTVSVGVQMKQGREMWRRKERPVTMVTRSKPRLLTGSHIGSRYSVISCYLNHKESSVKTTQTGEKKVKVTIATFELSSEKEPKHLVTLSHKRSVTSSSSAEFWRRYKRQVLLLSVKMQRVVSAVVAPSTGNLIGPIRVVEGGVNKMFHHKKYHFAVARYHSYLVTDEEHSLTEVQFKFRDKHTAGHRYKVFRSMEQSHWSIGFLARQRHSTSVEGRVVRPVHRDRITKTERFLLKSMVLRSEISGEGFMIRRHLFSRQYSTHVDSVGHKILVVRTRTIASESETEPSKEIELITVHKSIQETTTEYFHRIGPVRKVIQAKTGTALGSPTPTTSKVGPLSRAVMVLETTNTYHHYPKFVISVSRLIVIQPANSLNKPWFLYRLTLKHETSKGHNVKRRSSRVANNWLLTPSLLLAPSTSTRKRTLKATPMDQLKALHGRKLKMTLVWGRVAGLGMFHRKYPAVRVYHVQYLRSTIGVVKLVKGAVESKVETEQGKKVGVIVVHEVTSASVRFHPIRVPVEHKTRPIKTSVSVAKATQATPVVGKSRAPRMSTFLSHTSDFHSKSQTFVIGMAPETVPTSMEHKEWVLPVMSGGSQVPKTHTVRAMVLLRSTANILVTRSKTRFQSAKVRVILGRFQFRTISQQIARAGGLGKKPSFTYTQSGGTERPGGMISVTYWQISSGPVVWRLRCRVVRDQGWKGMDQGVMGNKERKLCGVVKGKGAKVKSAGKGSGKGKASGKAKGPGKDKMLGKGKASGKGKGLGKAKGSVDGTAGSASSFTSADLGASSSLSAAPKPAIYYRRVTITTRHTAFFILTCSPLVLFSPPSVLLEVSQPSYHSNKHQYSYHGNGNPAVSFSTRNEGFRITVRTEDNTPLKDSNNGVFKMYSTVQSRNGGIVTRSGGRDTGVRSGGRDTDSNVGSNSRITWRVVKVERGWWGEVRVFGYQTRTMMLITLTKRKTPS
eukprot:sb/3460486/